VPSLSSSVRQRTTPTSTSSTAPSSTLKISTNARCGKGFGFTCQGSQWGNCCSQYSFWYDSIMSSSYFGTIANQPQRIHDCVLRARLPARFRKMQYYFVIFCVAIHSNIFNSGFVVYTKCYELIVRRCKLIAKRY
jgi:hypothetical protein